jgi:predicted nucleic acid-binding protein
MKLEPQRVRQHITALRICSTTVTDVPTLFVYDRDPDDAHYVNVALAAQAKLIVSRDHDLLDLMDPSDADGIKFGRAFPTLRILQPVEFLREVQPLQP